MSMDLSAHDKAVLSAIFNPNLPINDSNNVDEELKDAEEMNEEVLHVQKMEIEAIRNAEKGNLIEGLNILNNALKILPQKPSLYNNRAHIYQYMRKFQDAFNDLTVAIELSTEENHKKTLSQAFCQRGILHKRAERKELAKADFENAAKLGSKFAKTQLVEMNPYAALCNQMLKQVMEKLN